MQILLHATSSDFIPRTSKVLAMTESGILSQQRGIAMPASIEYCIKCCLPIAGSVFPWPRSNMTCSHSIEYLIVHDTMRYSLSVPLSAKLLRGITPIDKQWHTSNVCCIITCQKDSTFSHILGKSPFSPRSQRIDSFSCLLVLVYWLCHWRLKIYNPHSSAPTSSPFPHRYNQLCSKRVG